MFLVADFGKFPNLARQVAVFGRVGIDQSGHIVVDRARVGTPGEDRREAGAAGKFVQHDGQK